MTRRWNQRQGRLLSKRTKYQNSGVGYVLKTGSLGFAALFFLYCIECIPVVFDKLQLLLISSSNSSSMV